jgi:hypothetical protein
MALFPSIAQLPKVQSLETSSEEGSWKHPGWFQEGAELGVFLPVV